MIRLEQAVVYTGAIRELMQAELESITELNEIWQYIMENEKGHYGMLLELLRRLDPEQRAQYTSAQSQVLQVTEKVQMIPPMVRKGRLELLNHVRNDIKQELRMINEYEQLILKVPVAPIIQILNTINQDEKEHMEQLTRLILELDTDDYGPLK